MAASSEIAESLSLLEFDVENKSFRATYDSTRDPTSLAVVVVVATARGEDPQALSSLQTVLDTDALDNLTTRSTTGSRACDNISFRYEGFEITVTEGTVIEANPTPAEGNSISQ